MAIQVTGYFENPQSKLMYKNPLLELVPHLAPYGKILLDANILVDDQQVGAIGVEVDRKDLTYNEEIEDGHYRLFDGIQRYMLQWLQTEVAECTYEIVSPNKPKAIGDEAP